MIQSLSGTFTSSDVVKSGNAYYYQVQHNLGTVDYLVSVFDGNNEIRNTSNLYTVGANTLRIYLPNASINGTWRYYIYYNDGILNNLTIKKLFEQEQLPDYRLNNFTDYVLAFGNDSNSDIRNITLGNFKSLVQNSVDDSLYCVRGQNLDDVQDKGTARTNLGVYSKEEIDNLFGNFYPINGFIQSIGLFVPSVGLSHEPSVSTYKNLEGLVVELDTKVSATEGRTSLGIDIGYFDVVPMSGHTVTFERTSAPISVYIDSTPTSVQHYEVGQATIVPTVIGANVRMHVYLFCPRTGTFGDTTNDATVKGSIRMSIVSYT